MKGIRYCDQFVPIALVSGTLGWGISWAGWFVSAIISPARYRTKDQGENGKLGQHGIAITSTTHPCPPAPLWRRGELYLQSLTCPKMGLMFPRGMVLYHRCNGAQVIWCLQEAALDAFITHHGDGRCSVASCLINERLFSCNTPADMVNATMRWMQTFCVWWQLLDIESLSCTTFKRKSLLHIGHKMHIILFFCAAFTLCFALKWVVDTADC